MADSINTTENQSNRKLVNFRLDKREIERLRNRAKENERTVSGEVRKLIRDALNKGRASRGSE